MHKRMLDKLHRPSEEQAAEFVGERAWALMAELERLLGQCYDLSRETKFPFGNGYGWGFRYTHGKKLLLYVFFEDGGFCCTVSINDSGAKKVESMKSTLHPLVRAAWEGRYPCGENGGWVNCYIDRDAGMPVDIVRLVNVKVKPK